MTAAISVPDPGFADGLRRVSSTVEVCVWDGHADPPPGLDAVEFAVPPYPSANWTAEQFRPLPAVRAVQVLSAGFEPWLPITPPHVTICNGRGIHGGSTAELAVTGLLMHWHHLPVLAERQRRAEWSPLQGETADGKSVVVLGCGDVGRSVAERLHAFGTRTTVVGRHERAGISAVDALPRLCATHDALVIAVPLTPDTEGLVNAALLRLLPDGAVVVNVARGPILDTAAITAELYSGRLRAVLDVTDPEPLPSDHPLWKAPNLILTPHVAGGALGWRDRAQRLLDAQLRRLLAGQPLANIVRTPSKDQA